LWYDVGYGKTIAVAAALEWGFRNLRYTRALVISTRAIASSTWQEELEEWDFTQWLREHSRSLVGLTAKAREQQMFHERHTRIDSINFNFIPWMAEMLEKKGRHLGDYYDVVVVDEFTKVKAHDGKWFKTLATMVHPSHVANFWALSGSPASEGYLQLWAPMFLVDYGHRLGYTKNQFEERFFIPFGDRKVLKKGAAEQIEEVLRDVVMSVDKERYPSVTPPVVEHQRYLDLSEHQQSQYLALERDMMLRLKEGDAVAANAGVLCGKVMQFCSGAMFLVDELGNSTKKWESVHDGKLWDLEQLLNTRPGNMLVATGYTHENARIKERFSSAVFMNSANYDRVKRDWNRGLIEILYTNPASCGHGVNIQKGGNQLYLYTVPWSGELFEQIIGRLARSGQPQDHVDVHIPMFSGTVDVDVYNAVTNKVTVQSVLKSRMAA